MPSSPFDDSIIKPTRNYNFNGIYLISGRKYFSKIIPDYFRFDWLYRFQVDVIFTKSKNKDYPLWSHWMSHRKNIWMILYIFSGVCVARSLVLCIMCCRSLFVLLYFLFWHCVVCPSSIYGFWLLRLYLQTLLRHLTFHWSVRVWSVSKYNVYII